MLVPIHSHNNILKSIGNNRSRSHAIVRTLGKSRATPFEVLRLRVKCQKVGSQAGPRRYTPRIDVVQSLGLNMVTVPPPPTRTFALEHFEVH